MNELRTPRLALRPLTEADVTPRYVAWLNDPEVNRFLEVRFARQDLDSVKAWVRSGNADASRRLFGVFKDGEHIGNVTFYLIDRAHKCLRIGISIGRKDLQGQGLGLEALEAACAYAFGEMGFHRLEAGVYAEHEASLRLFEKAGFTREAVHRERCSFEGRFVDMILFARLAAVKSPHREVVGA